MKTNMRTIYASVALAFVGACSFLPGCETSDPAATASPVGNGGTSSAALCNPDTGVATVDDAACGRPKTDYTPRDPASAGKAYPACISDDNTFHVFDPSVGSNARVAAFEAMGNLLGWDGSKVPSPDDFTQARVAYSQSEGLESRVVRREDLHYPPAPKNCEDLPQAEQEQYADRCVSGVKIRPIINQAFADGTAGKDPVLAASRIESALLWFFLMSTFKEGHSCSTQLGDCDSAAGYYNGQQDRTAAPLGFGRYVKERSPEAHARVWDGLLAVRCWRDLDPGTPSSNKELEDRANAQVDRAITRGFALIVRDRLANAGTCAGGFESVKIMGPVLDREATLRDPVQAAILRAEIAKTDPKTIDVAKAQAAIDAIFPCP